MRIENIHALLSYFILEEMISFYEKRNPYTFNSKLLKQKLIDFELAENDFNPICLKNKHWELIKLDIYNFFK